MDATSPATTHSSPRDRDSHAHSRRQRLNGGGCWAALRPHERRVDRRAASPLPAQRLRLRRVPQDARHGGDGVVQGVHALHNKSGEQRRMGSHRQAKHSRLARAGTGAGAYNVAPTGRLVMRAAKPYRRRPAQSRLSAREPQPICLTLSKPMRSTL